MSIKCNKCDGTGKHYTIAEAGYHMMHKCDECHGTGDIDFKGKTKREAYIKTHTEDKKSAEVLAKLGEYANKGLEDDYFKNVKEHLNKQNKYDNVDWFVGELEKYLDNDTLLEFLNKEKHHLFIYKGKEDKAIQRFSNHYINELKLKLMINDYKYIDITSSMIRKDIFDSKIKELVENAKVIFYYMNQNKSRDNEDSLRNILDFCVNYDRKLIAVSEFSETELFRDSYEFNLITDSTELATFMLRNYSLKNSNSKMDITY